MQTLITIILILNVAIVLLLLYAAEKRQKSYNAFLIKQIENRKRFDAKIKDLKGGK